MTLFLPLLLALSASLLAPFSSLAALSLLPVALAALWREGWPSRTPLFWLLLGWLFWLPITLVWSQSPGLSVSLAAVLLCLPLAWLAGGALHRRGQLSRLLEYGLPTLLAVLLLWGLQQGPNTFTAKPQGPFNDPNTYAAVLNLLVLPLLACYLAADLTRQASWWRIGQLALLAATAFVALLTASRGASLALMLVLPALIWLARGRSDFKRKLLLLGTVIGCAYLAAYLVSGGANVGQRLVNTVTGGDPARLMLMKSAWLMIQDHPWLGTGLGSFRLLYPQYRNFGEVSTAGGWVHNDYLQFWQEAGLPMLLLSLGLVAWVAWSIWKTLRDAGPEALPRMGYLAAIAAILLHALVNFLFFFALVGTLVGLYLARLTTHASSATTGAPGPHTRAIRLAAGGYALILGWLLAGQVAVEVLLEKSQAIQQVLRQWDVYYPRYQVAYWISVMAPLHPTPPQIMGLELASLSGEGGPMRNEALKRMEAGWRLAPCYLPFANDALALIAQGPSDTTLRESGYMIAVRSLGCNPRHGLSYYYAGLFTNRDGEALEWWRAGMAASSSVGTDMLLAAAILMRTLPLYERDLATLAEKMARELRRLEVNPGLHADRQFWSETQYTLYRLAGQRYLDLLPARRE